MSTNFRRLVSPFLLKNSNCIDLPCIHTVLYSTLYTVHCTLYTVHTRCECWQCHYLVFGVSTLQAYILYCSNRGQSCRAISICLHSFLVREVGRSSARRKVNQNRSNEKDDHNIIQTRPHAAHQFENWSPHQEWYRIDDRQKNPPSIPFQRSE